MHDLCLSEDPRLLQWKCLVENNLGSKALSVENRMANEGHMYSLGELAVISAILQFSVWIRFLPSWETSSIICGKKDLEDITGTASSCHSPVRIRRVVLVFC